ALRISMPRQVGNRHARMPCPNPFFSRTLRWLGEVDVENVGDLVEEIEGFHPPCLAPAPNRTSSWWNRPSKSPRPQARRPDHLKIHFTTVAAGKAAPAARTVCRV